MCYLSFTEFSYNSICTNYGTTPFLVRILLLLSFHLLFNLANFHTNLSVPFLFCTNSGTTSYRLNNYFADFSSFLLNPYRLLTITYQLSQKPNTFVLLEFTQKTNKKEKKWICGLLVDARGERPLIIVI